MYTTKMMNKNNAFTEQYNKLREQVNPDIHELEHFLKLAQVLLQEHMVKTLKLKYLAMTTVPTSIQKTMSPYQLYASNSPLWTIELSANEIESFLDIEKNTGRLSEELFTQTYAYETNKVYIDIETGDTPHFTNSLGKEIG